MLAGLSIFQGGILGLNTAAVVLLYKMHRDIRDVARNQRHHWSWLKRIRRHIWPETFQHDNDLEDDHLHGPT